MHPFKRSGIALAMVVGLGLAAATAGAQTIYNWTGAADNNLHVAGNWLVGGSVPASPPTDVNDQPKTPSVNDSLVFDSATWTRAPRRLYTRTGTRWGSIVLNNGTVDYANDGNNQGNYSWGGTDTFVVGNGNDTPAVLDLNILNWNHGIGGNAGTKTYVVNSDGTLNSKRTGVYVWSNSASLNTVMRLVGGSAVFVGSLREEGLTNDINSYFSFEAFGSSFTFAKGTVGTSFGALSVVEEQFGDSFRLGGALVSTPGATLVAVDNGSTFTITAIYQAPAGTVILVK